MNNFNQKLLKCIAEDSRKDICSIAASACLLGIENKPVKLSKDEQIAIFGSYCFGKKTIIIDTLNMIITITFKICFGLDSNDTTYSFKEVVKNIAEGKIVKGDYWINKKTSI